jgi:hypothetical protein
MARTIAVRPLRDGVDQRSSWQVNINGARKDTHTKKSAAKRRARELAREGDVIQTHRTDGSIQERYTYRGGNDSPKGGPVPTESAVWDVDAIQDDYDDLTDVL